MMKRPSPRLILALAAALAATGFAGLVHANTQTLNVSGTVANAAPAFDPLTPLSATPNAGSNVNVQVSIGVADNNGYQDITTASNPVVMTVKRPDGSTRNASLNLACSTGSGLSATCTYTLVLGSSEASGIYRLYFNASDSGGANAALAWTTLDYGSLRAISAPTPASVAFQKSAGPIAPGQTSDASSISITNTGNAPTYVQVSMGSDLASGANTLARAHLKYSPNSDMSGSAAMSGTPTSVSGLSIAASGAGSLYLTLDVPTGTRAGAYTGTVSLTASAT